VIGEHRVHRQARQIGGTVVATVRPYKPAAASDVIAAQVKAQVTQGKGVVLNTASRFAPSAPTRQLSFFKDKLEVDKVKDALDQTNLVRQSDAVIARCGMTIRDPSHARARRSRLRSCGTCCNRRP